METIPLRALLEEHIGESNPTLARKVFERFDDPNYRAHLRQSAKEIARVRRQTEETIRHRYVNRLEQDYIFASPKDF